MPRNSAGRPFAKRYQAARPVCYLSGIPEQDNDRVITGARRGHP